LYGAHIHPKVLTALTLIQLLRPDHTPGGFKDILMQLKSLFSLRNSTEYIEHKVFQPKQWAFVRGPIGIRGLRPCTLNRFLD
jgi:hypothetical protein